MHRGEVILLQTVWDRKSKRGNFGVIKEGSEWPKASDPSILSEKRETHTHKPHQFFFMRKFSLVTWSGKNLPKLVSIFFHIQVSGLQRTWVVCNSLAHAFEHLQTWNIIYYIKYMKCETITDDVNSGPWIPNFQMGWNVIHSIQVNFV